MAIRLPRFIRSSVLVDKDGTPTLAFHQWWETTLKQIETSITNIQLALTAAGIALENVGVFPSFTTRTITASGTLTATDYLVLGDATGGAITATLPTVTSKSGSQIIVKKIDASANAVTVDGSGAETIDGTATVILAAQYDSVTLASNGIEWFIV